MSAGVASLLPVVPAIAQRFDMVVECKFAVPS